MTATFVNCTPHDIVFNDGTVFPKSGTVARVSATFSDILDGVCDQAFGTVQDLPDPELTYEVMEVEEVKQYKKVLGIEYLEINEK